MRIQIRTFQSVAAHCVAASPQGSGLRPAPCRFGASSWAVSGFVMRADVLTARRVGPYAGLTAGAMAFATPRALVVVNFAVVVRPDGYCRFCMTAVAFQLGQPPRAAQAAPPTSPAPAPAAAAPAPIPSAPAPSAPAPSAPAPSAPAPSAPHAPSLDKLDAILAGAGKQATGAQPLQQPPEMLVEPASPTALMNLHVEPSPADGGHDQPAT